MASKKKAGNTKAVNTKTANTLKITKRIVNTKRHTTGYVVNSGAELSIAKTRQLAKRGQISGVRVVGNHVQSQNGRKRLGDLPQLVK